MKKMKKDLIFAAVLLLVGAALWMFRLTGLTAHIVVSVLGVLALAVYTAATKRSWRIPALEVIMRVSYGIALISGIVIWNVPALTIGALGIVHRVFCSLFMALLVFLVVHKAIVSKK